MPPATLAKKTMLSLGEVNALILELAEAVGEPVGAASHTVANLLGLAPENDDLEPVRRASSVTTGDPRMDGLLGGGVQVGHITEFVGEACVPDSLFTLRPPS